MQIILQSYLKYCKYKHTFVEFSMTMIKEAKKPAKNTRVSDYLFYFEKEWKVYFEIKLE